MSTALSLPRRLHRVATYHTVYQPHEFTEHRRETLRQSPVFAESRCILNKAAGAPGGGVFSPFVGGGGGGGGGVWLVEGWPPTVVWWLGGGGGGGGSRFMLCVFFLLTQAAACRSLPVGCGRRRGVFHPDEVVW